MDIKDLLIWIPAAGLVFTAVLFRLQVRKLKLEIGAVEKNRENKIAEDAAAEKELSLTIEKLKKDANAYHTEKRRIIAAINKLQKVWIVLRGTVHELVDQRVLTRQDIDSLHKRIDDALKEMRDIRK